MLVSYTWTKSCLHDVGAYYGVIKFSHSINDITCYLLYVLDFSHWKCYLYTYVLNVGYKPLGI